MVERKLTDAQRTLIIPKIRALGYSFREIGKMYNVSDATIYYCIYPEKRRASMNLYSGRKMIQTVINGKITIIRGLDKRPRPELCELCSRKPTKAYHHWDDDDPSIGLWLCYRCHITVEVMDDFPDIDLHSFYLDLKEKAATEVVTERKRFNDEIEVKRARWLKSRTMT